MLMIFYSLLMLGVASCTEHQTFENKTVGVGDEVKLTCPRSGQGTLFWIKLFSGRLPTILGKTNSLKFVNQRLLTSKEIGTFVLNISKTKQSDSGVYYCVKTHQQDLIFLKGVFLKVEDVTQASASVLSEDSVTLQGSVIPDSQNKTCPADESVLCFAAGSLPAPHSSNYAQETHEDEQKRTSDLSTQKGFYCYFRNFSSSRPPTYYCAVATCGENYLGKEPERNVEGNFGNTVTNHTLIYLLCAALALSPIIVVFLTCLVIKLSKKSNLDFDVVTELRSNTSVRDNQENKETDDGLLYSAPTFTRVEYRKTETNTKPEDCAIYSEIKVPDST